MKLTQRKFRWVAMDRCGEWYAYFYEPACVKEAGRWFAHEAGYALASNAFVDFVPPRCIGWTQSLTEVEAE